VTGGSGASATAFTDAGLTGVRALIVDADDRQRTTLSGHLSDWGIRIGTVASAPAAMEELRVAVGAGDPYSVVVVDIALCGPDGSALATTIADDPDLSCRVVAMIPADRGRTRGDPGRGVCASLSKPVHPRHLRACLRIALGLSPLEVSGPPACRGPVPPGSPPGRILLAEDNPVNQTVAALMLAGGGYRVDPVSDGAAAVRAVTSGAYDAVLMDCQMPGMDGYQATRAIRALDGGAGQIPIIAMTAGAHEEDRRRCLAEGMDDYITKPISKAALLDLVERTIGSGAGPPPPSDGDGGGPTLDPVVLADLQQLGRVAGMDFLGELAEQFVHDTELGLRALRVAMVNGDANGVSRWARRIRDAAVQLGGRRLASSAHHLATSGLSDISEGGTACLHQIEADFEALRRALVDASLAHLVLR
jgi:CheY-like chemotaxis protein